MFRNLSDKDKNILISLVPVPFFLLFIIALSRHNYTLTGLIIALGIFISQMHSRGITALLRISLISLAISLLLESFLAIYFNYVSLCIDVCNTPPLRSSNWIGLIISGWQVVLLFFVISFPFTLAITGNKRKV